MELSLGSFLGSWLKQSLLGGPNFNPYKFLKHEILDLLPNVRNNNLDLQKYTAEFYFLGQWWGAEGDAKSSGPSSNAGGVLGDFHSTKQFPGINWNSAQLNSETVCVERAADPTG